MKKIVIGGLLLTVLFALLSCEEEECTQSFQSDVLAYFYRVDSLETEIKVSVSGFSLYALNAADSVIDDNLQQKEFFTMPLSPDFDQRSFVIEADSLIDTITVHYSSKLELINTACGFIPVYELDKFETTHNLINAIRIEEKIVNTDEKENIRIIIN